MPALDDHQMPSSPELPAVRTSFIGEGLSRLYVRDLGRGLPIVVVHGGPDFDHEYLLPDLDRLAGRYHLVYYDQRGRGRSFSGQSPEHVTIASETDDLDRVREWTTHARIAVLGHSWGGLLALEYAIRHPDRVSHLIVLNPAPVSHQDALTFGRSLTAGRTPQQTARMDALRTDPAYMAGDIAADAEYHRIHFSTAVRVPAHLDQVIRRLRLGFTPEGLVAARRIEAALYGQTWSREGYDLLPALRSLRNPTLVIHGDHDFIPVEVARRIASAIPDARLAILQDCGHFAYLEQPELVEAAISNLLDASGSMPSGAPIA
jgi:proline iminopeptidase